MHLNTDFELVELADEHLAIPVGEKATSFKGVVTISNSAYFLLSKMNISRSKEELLELLVNEFDVDKAVAQADLDEFLKEMLEMGVIEK